MTTTRYVWDVVNDNYLSENDGASTTAVYTNEPSQFGDLASQRRSGASRYHHFDAQGSTRALTDASENVTDTDVYSAFGEGVASTGNSVNPFGFKGALGYHTDSETDDLYVRARTYWPLVGRWLLQDPIYFADGMNLYTYAWNRPLGFYDATGQSAVPYSKCHFHSAVKRRDSTFIGCNITCTCPSGLVVVDGFRIKPKGGCTPQVQCKMALSDHYRLILTKGVRHCRRDDPGDRDPTPTPTVPETSPRPAPNPEPKIVSTGTPFSGIALMLQKALGACGCQVPREEVEPYVQTVPVPVRPLPVPRNPRPPVVK